MNKIIFSDNTEYSCGFCGLATVGLLFITLENITLADGALIFSDPNKTEKIRYVGESGQDETFEHYIKLEYIVNEPTGGVRAALRQKYASEVST